ncbi:MAG: T9SS type A sorting domain-containing protein [Bacteroidales bacterium]|nr:T9SS type A sorting domain-containing protein [Bacteroidales bacterium]
MKTRNFFKTLLLLVVMVVVGGFSQQTMAQEDTCAVNVIHTYMNGRLIPWDSVEVKVTRNVGNSYYIDHSFMMYPPDTILSNCVTGIHEHFFSNGFSLSQSFPNPCQGENRVKLTTQTAGSVKLQVMDMQGRLCCQRTGVLPAGEHQLSITLPHSGVYFVQAETDEGRKMSKVLCTEGRGSGFDIRVISSSYQIEEKVEKGGEGLFNMTDRMIITAYITYNGEVRSNGWLVNYTDELDGQIISEWLYNQGSVNIHFNQRETCEDFTFANKSSQLIVSSSMCLPFMDYPVGCNVTFYDSTFYSVPESCFQSLSSTWQLNGWYKYRYYPSLERMCVCGMDETLPPDVPSPTSSQMSHCVVRIIDVVSCDAIMVKNIGQVGFYGEAPYEYMIFNQ